MVKQHPANTRAGNFFQNVACGILPQISQNSLSLLFIKPKKSHPNKQYPNIADAKMIRNMDPADKDDEFESGMYI